MLGRMVTQRLLSEALRDRREQLGLTQEQAAEQIGVSRQTFLAWEREDRKPTVDAYRGIASFLDITIEEFFALLGASVMFEIEGKFDLYDRRSKRSPLPDGRSAKRTKSR